MVISFVEQISDVASALRALAPFVTDERKEKIARVLGMRLMSVHVAAESPTDIHNAFAIVRTAEAMGVPNVHIIDPELRTSEGKGTMRGTNYWSSVSFHRDFGSFQKKAPTCLVGTVPDGNTSLDVIPLDKPITLMFGNENRGLSQAAKESCDYLVTIPMYGMAESYNLSVSAGIVLAEVTKRKRCELAGKSDISEAQLSRMMLRAYVRTVGFEAAKVILRHAEV